MYTYRRHRAIFALYGGAMLLPLCMIGTMYYYTYRHGTDGAVASGEPCARCPALCPARCRGVTSTVVHVHHWWIGFYVSFFTRYRWWLSRLCAPIFVGVAVEGIVDAPKLELFILDHHSR